MRKTTPVQAFFWDDAHDPSEAPINNDAVVEEVMQQEQLPVQPPKITCYCCGNPPKQLQTSDLYWQDKFVFTGNCCSKSFTVELSKDLIKEKNVATYVVNMV